MTDSNSRALVEVEVTFHADAIRQMLTRQHGFLVRTMGAVLVFLLGYFCIGLQAVLPRTFPELQCYPFVLFLAFCSLRAQNALGPALIALLGGWMLDASWTMRPGSNALLLLCASAVVSVMAHHCDWWPVHRGWTSAALAGALSNAIYSMGTLCFLAGNLSWQRRCQLFPWQVVGGTMLAALAYAPLLFALADCVSLKRPVNTVPRQKNVRITLYQKSGSGTGTPA